MGAEIFQPYLQPPKSIQDYENEYADAQARRQNNALRAMAMQQQVDQRNQGMASQNALRRLAAGWNAGTSDDQRIADLLNSGDPTLIGQADTMRKTAIERRKGEASASKDEADAAKTKDAMTADKYRRNVQQVMALGGPQEAIQGLQQQIQAGQVDPQMGGLLLKSIPQDPAAFGSWKLQMVASLGDPKAMVEMLKPHLQTVNLGGSQVQQAVDPLTGKPTTTGTMLNTQSPDNAATNATSRANNAATVGATMRGQNLTDARQRDLNAITREAQQTQLVNDPAQGILLVNKGTGLTRPALGLNGQPIPSENAAKTATAAKRTLPVIDEARKLIGESTGSYVGRGIDYAARAVGATTAGDAANAKLKVLEGNIMLAQPRMEGPQSDKDVMLYRQMAGQIGDATVPAEIKMAALDTIDQLQRKYAGGPGPAAPSAAPAAAGGFRIVGVK